MAGHQNWDSQIQYNTYSKNKEKPIHVIGQNQVHRYGTKYNAENY